jgi:hypothetical protein
MTSWKTIALACLTAVGFVVHTRNVGTPVWSVDFVTTKSGEHDRYLRFLEANWVRARRTARASGHILSYRVLTASDSSAGWDVALLTEYADSLSYAQRESAFGPILAAQGLTRIDGKGPRDLTSSIKNVLLTAAYGEP